MATAKTFFYLLLTFVVAISSSLSEEQDQQLCEVTEMAAELKKDAEGEAKPIQIAGIELKKVSKSFTAHTQREGKGFIVNRPIGGWAMSDEESDPFLLLDEVGPKDYKKGEFEGTAMHPHRGFETVMYMKEGYGTHEDSLGNSGILNPGDCQFMRAGRGIVHQEGKDHPGGMLHGFQMWINLPKTHKMIDPLYQTALSKSFPFKTLTKGVKAKALCGNIYDPSSPKKILVESPIKPVQPLSYIDYNVEKGASFIHKIQEGEDTLIVYVYEGKGQFQDGGKSGDKKAKMIDVERKSTLLFKEAGDSIYFKANDDSTLGFLVLAGKKIKEPISRHGPFVMNTREEIMQAFEDYRSGKLATVKGKMVDY